MNKVFYKTSEPAEQGFDIGTIFDRNPVKGDVGLEIEVEGNKFPKRAYKGYDPQDANMIPKVWNYHRDGSLRGKDNAEYVLFKPLEFNEVPEAVEALFKMFSDYGSVLDVSNRTSVHAHLNVQRWHLDRLCTFMAMYFSLEEILTQWCGEHRVGNLFCLRAKDAPAIVTKLKRFLQKNGDAPLDEGLHYAGFNAHALTKFGSVEFRTLRGCQDPKVIIDWIEILRALYDKSQEFSDPRQLMEDFSGNSPVMYLEKLLGDKTKCVLDGVSMTSGEVNDSIYEGIRMAQDLTYCRDWSLYTKVDVKKDPFGRLAKEEPVIDINTLQIKPIPLKKATFGTYGELLPEWASSETQAPPLNYEAFQAEYGNGSAADDSFPVHAPYGVDHEGLPKAPPGYKRHKYMNAYTLGTKSWKTQELILKQKYGYNNSTMPRFVKKSIDDDF